MDFSQQKYNSIKSYLQQKLLFQTAKNINEYKKLVKEIIVDNVVKKVWTDAFKIALKENEHIYIPYGEYYVDDTVVIPSNRKITADKNAVVLLLKGTKVVMFRNENVLDGTRSKLTLKSPHDTNVEIEGGVWGTEYDCRAEYGKVGAYDEKDGMHGVHALMLFSGVENLWIKNVTYKNTATFALQIGRTENFLIENIKFIECYADGVHLNGEIKRGVVYNVSGHTEDDLVALNAYDWDNSTINNGSMEDIIISKISSIGGYCNCMRIQAGVTSESMGNIDCSIKDMHISYISGVQTFKLYLQTPPYVAQPEGAKVGFIDNITFENIKIDKIKPSDNGPNYYDKNLITGHFGIFEIGSNISKITLKNIDFNLNLFEYPDTSHLITVGPKSWYVASKNLEIFDPYACSLVKEIILQNVTFNGKIISNIKDYIKEIEFDNIYPSKYSSGNGKIKSIKQIK